MPTPNPHVTLPLPHWPPTIRDIKSAFYRIERKGVRVVWVTVAQEDLRAIDLKQFKTNDKGETIYRFARFDTHVRNTPEEITLFGEIVDKRGPMFGRRYKVTLVKGERVRRTLKGRPPGKATK